jgi:membrane protease YdiL (CAAX protease family)
VLSTFAARRQAILAGACVSPRRRTGPAAARCGAPEQKPARAAQAMNIRLDPDDLLRRLTLVARGLGFVFPVYFVPVVARDLLGGVLPGGGIAGALHGDPAGPWLPLAASVATLGVSAWMVRLHARTGLGAAEPRPLLPLDRRAATEWGRGALAGAACATLAVLPLVPAGAVSLRVAEAPLAREALAALAVALLLVAEAAREELGFRGPAQRDLAHATRFLPAAIFLAGSFALIHRANPVVTGPGLVGVFAAGVALAGVVRARGDLSMACGVHAGWNVCLGMVWSLPVSGHRVAHAALEATSRDSIWTGAAFGPEGGPTGIAAFALLGIVAWTRRPAEREGRVPRSTWA